MRTERLPADPASIARASEVLRKGGLVAFPTETVYGLGARADDGSAAQGIFRAKGRPAGNPLIVHVGSVAEAKEHSSSWSEDAERLAVAFWPGPLTLIVERSVYRIADEVAAGGPTVAIRVPAHPVARALLDACRLPIAAPSANRSTSISPTTADHVLKSLDGRIDMVLDGGGTGYGIESTIVDVTASPAVILRHGAVSIEAIAALIAVLDRADVVLDPGQRAASPGSHARHYAPRARALIVPRAALSQEVLARQARGEEVGVLAITSGWGSAVPAELGALGARVEVLPGDPVGYAAGLYAALHRLDDAACDSIVIEAVPEEPAWAAVSDRLRRASA